MNGLFRPEWSTLKRLMFLQSANGGGYATISGNPVSFTARNAPLRKLSVAFSPVQSGSGDPSPDNVRPILGWDSLTVEQRGKNLLTWAETYDRVYYSSAWHGTGDKVTDFTPSTAKWASVRVYVKGLSNVTVSGMPSVGGVNGIFEYADGSIDYDGRWGSAQHNGTHAVPNGAVYMWMGVQISETDIRTAYPNAMAESGTTASEYVPYNGRSISINIGSAVYSGTVDVCTGVGEVDKAYRLLNDAGKWVNSSGTVDYYYNEEFTDRKLLPTSYEGVICSYVQIRDQSGVAYGRWQSATNYRFGIRANGTGLTIDDVKAAATAGKIAICYALATPQTIQLTPQEVSSLLGDNVLFSDANGDLTVEYRSN